jgi:hypothetical protein
MSVRIHELPLSSEIDPENDFLVIETKTGATYTTNRSTIINVLTSILPANVMTTTLCAMSGDGSEPFKMQFVQGLLTSITY